jgi:hypothetical protein
MEIIFSKSEIDDIGKYLRAPAGKSGRVMHFYAKDGCEAEALQMLEKKVGERGYLIKYEDAIRTFVGKTTEMKMGRLRLGDIVLILKAGANAEIRREEDQGKWEDRLHGSHGSTTLNELLVPFISARVSQLKKY